MMNDMTLTLPDPQLAVEGDSREAQRCERCARDYAVVAKAVSYLTEKAREQPELDDVAAYVGLSPFHFQRLFTRWAGISPKAFLAAMTVEHARHLLRQSATVLDTTYEVGLSGPGRLHDLFITYEAMSPGAYKSGGEGLELNYGFHNSPFGVCLAVATDRGLAGLAWADSHSDADRRQAFEDMSRRWPRAKFTLSQELTAGFVASIFQSPENGAKRSLNLVFVGTEFDLSVWRTLLKIPPGFATTYSDIARHIGNPKAARAVGGAVGRNPVSFIVPCHRVLRANGDWGGYHWGVARKQAIIGWEAAPFIDG